MDLIKACTSNDTKKALGLIKNNDTNLNSVDSHGRTLKTHHQRWCVVNAPDFWIVLCTIKNEQVSDNGITALIWACYGGMTKVALELIKTGHAKPDYISKDGSTALICACYNRMTEVALELIKTGHAKPKQVNNDGYMALSLACENGMKEVADALV